MQIAKTALMSALLMTGPVRAAPPICSDSGLEGFAPNTGSVSGRSWIDSPVDQGVEDVELAHVKVRCKKRESNETCIGRTRAKARKAHPGKIFEVSQSGRQTGLSARLVITRSSGERESIERAFPSQAALLDYVDARTEKGAQVDLLQATPLYDPAQRTVEVRVLEGRERLVNCKLEESDATCKQRWTTLGLKDAPKATTRVEVELQGKLGGYVTQLDIDGALTTMVFPSTDAATRFVQARQKEKSQVVMLRMDALLDPKTRRAKLRIVHTRKVEMVSKKWLRLIWTPGDDLVEAIKSLNDQAATAGFQIMRYEPQPDGGFLVELRCPKG